MKKWFFAIFSIVALFFVFLYISAPKKHAKHTLKSYFVSIPVSRYTNANQPCITFEIEGQKISGILDLGFRGHLALNSKELSRIQKKTLVESEKKYNFRGTEFEQDVYAIPPIHIGSLLFSNVQAHQEGIDFQKETIVAPGEVQSFESARLGWNLFSKVNLLLDFKNGKIVFCDSMKTLQKKGVFSENFLKVPFKTNRGFIEIQAIANGKTLSHCVLDTGATCNVMNDPLSSDSITCLSFQIGREEWGPISFRHLPLNFPISVDAILGMDFLSEHRIFLDFSENMMYILRS